MSSHSDIENFNKEYDERDQINKGDNLEKGADVKRGLTGSKEVLKLGITSSRIFIEKYSDERDQRDNDDQIEEKQLKSMNKH